SCQNRPRTLARICEQTPLPTHSVSAACASQSTIEPLRGQRGFLDRLSLGLLTIRHIARLPLTRIAMSPPKPPTDKPMPTVPQQVRGSENPLKVRRLPQTPN